MFKLHEIVQSWKLNPKGWRIAPEGLPWITAGSKVKLKGECVFSSQPKHIGDDFSAGNCFSAGDDFSAGYNCADPVIIGFADGYWKQVCHVNGVAYIGAGCRWFTLDEAKKHWENHTKNRELTLCLLQSAYAIAKLKGWKTDE